jgi:hypothetical protein
MLAMGLSDVPMGKISKERGRGEEKWLFVLNRAPGA